MALCDVCQVESPFMCSLADLRTRELLNECIGLTVQPGDSYPQRMCSDCWSQCRSWSIFRKMALSSYRQVNPRPVVVPEAALVRITASAPDNAVTTTTTIQRTTAVQQTADNVIAGTSRQVPTTTNGGQPTAPLTCDNREKFKCNTCSKEYVRYSVLKKHIFDKHTPKAARKRNVTAIANSSGNKVIIQNNYGNTQ